MEPFSTYNTTVLHLYKTMLFTYLIFVISFTLAGFFNHDTPKNYEKHPKTTANSPQKCKICSFSRSIRKILHRTEFFTQAPPVTNMRYASPIFLESSGYLARINICALWHLFMVKYNLNMKANCQILAFTWQT